MNRLFSFLIKHKYWVIAFFVLICIPAVMGMRLVGTNFEISTFMPGDANSVTGSIISEEEFSTAMRAYVYLKDKENWQTLALKERIESIDGVYKVDWMDDVLDIYTPEEFLSKSALEQYKKGNATILITEFGEDVAQEVTDSAIRQISDLMEDGEYFGGQPVVLNEMRELLDNEQAVYLIIAGGILIILLAISLSSYMAPLLCIINIGIAILLNYGTNFIIKDEVSFLTMGIAAILQLAVSMDYSIFLIHRFEEDLQVLNGDVDASMVSSMRATLTAISSSAMTDCAGFIALIFMQNAIGADLGLVLSKGVIFSLIVSITFLPCLILATYKAGKKKHRVFLPSFKKLSGPLIKYRYVLLALVIVILIPAFIANGQQDYYYTTEEFMPDDTEPIIATKLVGETFGTTDSVYVLYKKDMAAYEPAAIEAIESICNIREVGGISDSVQVGIPESFLPEELKDAYIGEQYRRFTVTLERDLGNDALFSAIGSIRDTAGEYLGEVYLTGAYASAADMASTAEWDNVAVEFISMAFIFIILLIAYRSLLIPVFLVIVIKAAIYINVGINAFFGDPMIFLTPVLVGSIQLGATVDYAILFTSRYFEFRHKVLDAKEAVRQTMIAAVRPMLTSVLTFFFATLSITLVSSIKATREIATVIGRGALISLVVILFALPALFIAFDKALMATTLEFRKQFYPKRDRG
ncbi:MAG: MMPL family transporter [Eubacteriales bacterium]|nr:MMPL family transporter [Eubacteriales bacterium]